MSDVIVFNYDGPLAAVMSAAPNSGLTILETGMKDVPADTPFWIVDASTITDDYAINPDALGAPSGYGGTFARE